MQTNSDVLKIRRVQRTFLLFTDALILVILFVSFMGTTCVAEENGTLLIGIYASGNTLEKDYGLVTRDFIQVVSGAGNVSPKTLEVLAAYGGANKTGWDGVTIANLSLLRKDLDDGILGNNASYLYRNTSANMGDPNTLGQFLSMIKKDFRYDRVFLIFIGHGEAYTGMLFDQNHQDDGLTITELSDTLNKDPADLELIGFDTCLMSCLEVASVIRKHASFLIASEESEPADGWDYEHWIRYLSENPDAPAVNHSQVLFSKYMNMSEPGKTISLLDLKSIDFLTSNVERFGGDLTALCKTPEGMAEIHTALMKTQQFGLNSDGKIEEATMDLYDFAENIRALVPYLNESAGGVIEGVDKTVIYAKHDQMVPDAHGVAILSPVLINPVFFEYYMPEAFITPGWEEFVKSYLAGQDKLLSAGSSIVSSEITI